MSDDLEVTGTESTASTAVFCSSFTPHMFFPEIVLGLSEICAWNLAVVILTHALKFLWQNMKASVAEQKGRWQSARAMSISPCWHLACSVQLGKTNGKSSLPIQPLHANFVFHMEAFLYSLSCLSFCHVSFLSPFRDFFFVSSSFLFYLRWGYQNCTWYLGSRCSMNSHSDTVILFFFLRILNLRFSFFFWLLLSNKVMYS